MNPYMHYTTATDTHELPAALVGPYFDRRTVELNLLDLHPPVVTPARHRRPTLAARVFAALRKAVQVLLLTAFLIVLSIGDADARPVHDQPRYYGPSIACWTAGIFPWGAGGCR